MREPPPDLERTLLARRGKREGDEIRFRCPFPERHNNGDANPSARYNTLKQVWCCDACGENGGWKNLNEALGLSMTEAAALKPKVVETYDYRDEKGVSLRRKLRWQPGFKGRSKFFTWEKPNGGDEWVKCQGDGNPKVLYGSWRLPAARTEDKQVFLVEGEKDCNAANARGLVAVCNPEGAGSWKLAYTKQLQGLDIVIIADKDKPGRKHAQAAARSLDGKARSVAVIELPGKTVKDLSDWLAGRKTGDTENGTLRVELDRIIEDVGPWSPTEESDDSETTEAPAKKLTQAQQIVELAVDVTLFHTPDNESFAVVPEGSHVEVWALRSPSFRRWLMRAFYQATDKPPSAQALKDAIDLLGAKAQFEGEERAVAVRVAGIGDGSICLDLANPDWELVEITGEGWRTATHDKVRFTRARGMKAIPTPAKSADIGALQRFINVPDESDFILVVAWLLATLRPTGPYPILVLQGEQGSAKSTTARVLRSLVDPATAPIRSSPRDEHDLMIAAQNSWVLAFDNLSNIPPWLSDAMCRLATGGGFATRQLYTDTEETILEAQRPLLLNGIDELTTRQDLLDRSITVQLPAIHESRRRAEQELWADFEAARPGIVGALLSAVSTGLCRRAEVTLDTLPRMADFAKWITATEPALPWPAGSFLTAYRANREESVSVALENDLVASALIGLLEGQDKGWTGTATALLAELETHTAAGTPKTRAWPKNARALSSRLRRAATFLRTVGVEVEFSREPGKGSRRVLTVKRNPGICVASVACVAPSSQAIEEPSTSEATQNPDATQVATQSATQTAERNAPVSGLCDASDAGDANSRTFSPEARPATADLSETPSPGGNQWQSSPGEYPID